MIPGKNMPDGMLTPYVRTVKIYQVNPNINISLSLKVALLAKNKFLIVSPSELKNNVPNVL